MQHSLHSVAVGLLRSMMSSPRLKLTVIGKIQRISVVGLPLKLKTLSNCVADDDDLDHSDDSDRIQILSK